MSIRTRTVEKLDRVYSEYVRLSHADDTGCISCWTCGLTVNDYKQLQAGHFQSRVKYNTRWHFREIDGKIVTLNCKPQCPKCNLQNGGQQWMFGKRLDEVYGEGTAMSIIQEGMQIRKFTTDELKELIEFFKEQKKML